MSVLRSLRAQVTMAATVVVALVIAVAGIVIATRSYEQQRQQVDSQLAERAAKVAQDVAKSDVVVGGGRAGDLHDGIGDSLLAGSDSVSRVLVGSTLIDQRGDLPATPIPLPATAGYQTVRIGNQRWRSLTREVDATRRLRIQVLQNLAALDQRVADNRRLILLVTALAVVATAIMTWVATGLLLRPLERLRVAARHLQPGALPTDPLPAVTRPREVADLTDTLNSTLARLETSAATTRQFAADAGHELRTPLAALGMDLETLRRHELPSAQRAEMLDAMATEHARLAKLVDGLLVLARGDAEVLPSRELFDLNRVLEDAVDAARRRHPRIDIQLHALSEIELDGWDDGLRLAVDNLVENAARHGTPHGTIRVTASRRDDQHVDVAVEDDGPGIPESEREHVLERFVRGAASEGGSGLGLAVVEQQARLNGGALRLGTSQQLGGLSAVLTLPFPGG